MKVVAFDPAWSADTKNVFFHDRQEMQDETLAPHIYWRYQRRLKLLEAAISTQIPPGGSVLDVGCAQATLALRLAEQGYSVVANDIREEHLRYARLRYEEGDCRFVCGNFLDLDWQSLFDAIVFTEVIEHLIDHRAFLMKLNLVLRPGGLLLITTPNQAYFRAGLPRYGDADLEAHRHKEFSADGDAHFYLFTIAELRELLATVGFEVIEHSFFGSFVEAGHLKTRYLWRWLGVVQMRFIAQFFEGSRLFCESHFVLARKCKGNS